MLAGATIVMTGCPFHSKVDFVPYSFYMDIPEGLFIVDFNVINAI